MQNRRVALILDTAAAVVRPDDLDLRAWMSEQRVFMSSVMGGMTEVRRAVADAIAGLGATPVYFEDFGGRDDDAEAAYLGEVAASTIYVGILGAQYGRLLKSRLSATHEEYRAAEKLGLSISAWIARGETYNSDQANFIDEIRLFHTTGSYEDASDLTVAIVRRLQEIAAADLSPWVKLGDLVFRARKISDDGRLITLDASSRSQLVVSALEQLRPGGWSGKQERRLTYNGRSCAARIMSVDSSMTTRSTTHITIGFERTMETDVGTPMSISIGGHTYDFDEASMLHVRHALFGDSMPRSLLTMGGRVDAPFKDLPTDLPSDELQRAVMRLLITEALVRSGRASRVHKLDISPEGPSGRVASVTWASPTGRGRETKTLSAQGTLTPLQT